MANGEGAFGVAVADDGAFLAFICGMAARTGVWFSGDWYRGHPTVEPVIVSGPEGEQLRLSRTAEGGLSGAVTEADSAPVMSVAEPAAPADGLFRRGDADGVLGAIALPGNTVCAVKRRDDGCFLAAGTVLY